MNAIEAENLSKHYRVYIRPFDRLKESILRRPCHHLVNSLADVSFRLSHGDTLGIIGENGAGKSTLLKILAGTLQPSSGRLALNGRVAALLELGAGFNPEFSGRTNIHLNAALLGLTEKEIRAREEEIIAFSELAEVIDRPVKTYSSGMHVRLAFSIATSVDPEILIVDEALSVGDQRFAQKCVDRMAGFRNSGKTIIVCSHSMVLINALCEKTIWLNKGIMKGYDQTSQIISEYIAYLENKEKKVDDTVTHVNSGCLPEVLIEKIRVCSATKGVEITSVEQFQEITIEVDTRCTKNEFWGHIAIGLEGNDGQMIFASTSKTMGMNPIHFSGHKTIRLSIPSFKILKGSFRAKALISDHNFLRVIHEDYGDLLIAKSEHPEFGMFWMDHEWMC